MATVTIHQAKTNLSKLIARAEAGEEIIIARGKEAVVRLQPVAKATGRRALAGMFKDRWPHLPDSFFFDPLPEEELRLFEGGEEDDASSP
ncbi:MAG TPA: type II toxin-antitoxin system prevent-host-death family antitoxin [Bauldia sp.]|nr:type II toxin-antitoxin system prevent-host-death family antitoxin [Bauldia sp.]